MQKTIFRSFSAEETKKIGICFGDTIKKLPPLTTARVIGLCGDLGAGKTTFTQGVTKSLGVKKRTTSPTFVLIKRFSIKAGAYKNFFHIDAYRLSSFKDLYPLEIQKIIKDPKAIIFIEWVENISSKELKLCGTITLKHRKNEQRLVTIKLLK